MGVANGMWRKVNMTIWRQRRRHQRKRVTNSVAVEDKCVVRR